MRFITLVALLLLLNSAAFAQNSTPAANRNTGVAKADNQRPATFPHRIWAACDFEAQTPDYAWFGPANTKNTPQYPGNVTALGATPRDAKKQPLMTGINPVPGPMMGEENFLYLRYLLKGSTEATFQHFSLSTEDNNHIRATDLTEGKWSEVTLNFSRDARRNDGTPGVPFKKGERMDDLKVFVGKPGDGREYDLLLDDVIFFANDPKLPSEPEPFPQRVIFLAAFDTGTDEKARTKYWPGEFDLVTKDLPKDAYWGVARSVPRKEGGPWIRIEVAPPRPVGAHTKLRFRYHLTGAKEMTVQMFDATAQDNRHIRLRDCREGEWMTQYLDFTKDSHKNDGKETPFAAGNKVDDLFFFIESGKDARLLVDEVVLFDAGEKK